MLGPIVGFDLDMTLVDPRPGVVASYDVLARETGVRIDGHAASERLGPKLELEIARWFPAEAVESTAARYREIFATHGVDGTSVLAGAAAALAEVRRQGGRSVVVTAKSEPLATATLERLGLDVDEVRGGCWAEGKAEALRAAAATLYVGDHVADVAAARAAGLPAVAVASGSCSGDALRAAGADVVLATVGEFPAWLSQHLLPGRLAALEKSLQQHERVLVAFSGGADSAFVLAAAVRALGAQRVVAATAVSPSLPAAELAAASSFAASLGVRHLTPRTDEMSREGYRANAGDRCYFCKAELLDVLAPLAAEQDAVVATGTNADDARSDFRPGIRAAAERGAVTPLRDAGLTKDQVRAASRAWGLVTWDKPAAACLSSRIAYGVEVTPSRLARVERAEVALRAAFAGAGIPVQNLRVRDLGGRARVEVDRELVAAVAARPELLAAVSGFDSVELDTRGFRSGSMNEALQR